MARNEEDSRVPGTGGDQVGDGAEGGAARHVGHQAGVHVHVLPGNSGVQLGPRSRPHLRLAPFPPTNPNYHKGKEEAYKTKGYDDDIDYFVVILPAKHYTSFSHGNILKCNLKFKLSFN